MKIDEVIKRRFEELAQSAKNLGSIGVEGTSYVNPEILHMWASSVLNLFKRAFGEKSTCFQSFSQSNKQKSLVENAKASYHLGALA